MIEEATLIKKIGQKIIKSLVIKTTLLIQVIVLFLSISTVKRKNKSHVIKKSLFEVIRYYK